MEFKPGHLIVVGFVNRILKGELTIDDIKPGFYNLREVVGSELERIKSEEESDTTENEEDDVEESSEGE